MDPSRIAQKARQAVAEAGDLITGAIRRPKTVSYKARNDLLTETDLAVEKALKASLGAILPGAAFLAEETAGATVLDRPCWVVDPVDGTTNFAHGLPLVATSVALWAEGRVELGLVNLPVLGEMFWAVRGQGAFLGDQPLRVSEAPSLERALVATGFPYRLREFMPHILPQMEAVLLASQGVRRMGAAAIDLAFVACGRLDAFYEFDLKPWDTAAGWLLVEEAGGRVSRFDAPGDYTLGAASILASNGRFHEELRTLLAGAMGD